MPFDIQFTQTAADHLRACRKFDQKIVLDAIEVQLTHEPIVETRNRKRLGTNELSDWELRVQEFRVFYDVHVEDTQKVVKVKAIGHKQHGQLVVGGKEVKL